MKLECQKTINIMFCWWSIPFGNLREHSTSTGTDEDSRKGYAMVTRRGFVALNMATLDTKPADSVWWLSLDCMPTTEILRSYHTTRIPSMDIIDRVAKSSVVTRMAICLTTLIKTYTKVAFCLTACGGLVTYCGKMFFHHLFPAEACNCSLNQLWVAC